MVGYDITTGSLVLIEPHSQVELSLLYEYQCAQDPKGCQWLNADPYITAWEGICGTSLKTFGIGRLIPQESGDRAM